MGGTSIAMCVATPFVFGTIIGAILIAIGSVCSYQTQRFLVLLFQFISTMPFLTPALDDYWESREKPKASSISSMASADYFERDENFVEDTGPLRISSVSSSNLLRSASNNF